MDFQFGNILIHIDKTPAMMLALIPIIVIMQLEVFQNFFYGITSLNRFGVKEPRLPDEEEKQEE